jgi:hypothetical protein
MPQLSKTRVIVQRLVLLLAFVACSHAATNGLSASHDGGTGADVAPLAAVEPIDAGPAPPDASGPSADVYDDQDPTALQDFHPALDSHGTWTDDPTYGTVWVPNTAEVGADFVPYVSGGHWAYGDDYLWVSDYDWGWAPFHYGRWVNVAPRGWAWIPGRAYAPAWVEWRTGDAYVGWAPAPPLFVWRAGIAVTLGFAAPGAPFVFCRHADFFSSRAAGVVIVGPRAFEIERRTRLYAGPRDREHFGHGPPLEALHIPRERIVRATGREPDIVRAREFGRPSTAERLGAHPPARPVSLGREEPVRGEAERVEHGQVEPEHDEHAEHDEHTGHAEHAGEPLHTDHGVQDNRGAPRREPAPNHAETRGPVGHASAEHTQPVHMAPSPGGFHKKR